MILIHQRVSMFSRAGEIRPWIETLERWRREPVEEPDDLATIDYHLSNARKWLADAEAREGAAGTHTGGGRIA